MTKKRWQPDHTSGFNSEGFWRQTLDPFDAHVVDHGGALWIWNDDGLERGYRWDPTYEEGPVFYSDPYLDEAP